jgi:flavodoxin I
MKALVVYDSMFGNTEQIARRIGETLTGTVRVVKSGGVSLQDLNGLDLLVLGSPTVGGRATKPMQEFVENLPRTVAEKVRYAAFDTRISMKSARIFGYAAPRIAEALSQKGGCAVLAPEGFIVKGRSGPLADGELQRASEWAKRLGAAAGA